MAEQEIINAIIVATIIFSLLVGFVLIYTRLHYKKILQHEREVSSIKSSFQQEILHTQLEIREQTLKNIAQEIHDNIGQTLSLAKLNLNTINLADNAKANDKITSSKELVSKAIHDLRYLSKSMNMDSILAAGLLKAVKMELEIVEKSGIFETHLEVGGIPSSIDPKKELILFRMVQEALNNIIKHSGATRIEVAISFETFLINIKIKDNGHGFENSLSSETLYDGIGLKNMNSRILLIDGKLEIRTQPGNTVVEITAPI